MDVSMWDIEHRCWTTSNLFIKQESSENNSSKFHMNWKKQLLVQHSEF